MGNYFSRKMKVISSILIAALFIGMLPWRELSADSNTHGEYNAFPFEITYEQNSTWNNSTQGQFTITNTSSEAVTQWRLEIVYGSDVTITNIWDATDVTDYDNDENITVSGSSRISAGGTYTFGLIAEGEDSAPVAPIDVNTIQFISEEPTPTPTPTNTPTPTAEPTNTPTPTAEPTPTGEPSPTTEPTITPTPAPTSDFPYAVFAGSITTDFSFMGWKSYITGDVYSGKDFLYQGSELYMTGYARTVGHVLPAGWTTSMTGAEEGIDPIAMPQWGDAILARMQEEGDATNIIYSANSLTIDATTYETTTESTVIYSSNGDITFIGDQITINGLIYAPNGRVTISANNATVNGRIVANEVVYNGSILTVAASDTDLDFIYGVSDITPTPTPIPTITPADDTDSDEDGLPDTFELELGTDPNNPDSDFDGIPDGIEVFIGYDPNEPDSDGDLINDGNEDYDEDGLTNIEELNRGTKIAQKDSDLDDLEDGEEVYTYHTDPLNNDSDGDGILDGDEIYLGKDPNDPSDGSVRITQTIDENISNSEDSFISSVEVSVSLANRIDRVLSINDLYNIDVYSTNLVGRKGSPVGFECEEQFTSATIVFHYDESLLGDTQEEDLGVLWYDEEHGLYLTQTQAVVDTTNNTITLVVTHFSTYVITDLNVWNNIEPIQYDVSSREKTFDYIFAIDLSQNNTIASRENTLSVLTDFLGRMREGDRAIICYFGRQYMVDPYIVTNSDEAEYLLSHVENNLMNNALPNSESALYIQALYGAVDCVDYLGESDNERQLIIFSNDTDGAYYSNIDYMSPIISGGFEVTLALTAYRDQSSPFVFGQRFAELVGADFYNYGDYGSSLWDEFYANHGGQVEEWTDLDGDGVADFMEEQGILLSNGQVITTKTNPIIGDDGHAIGYDSDGDGLSDGEELGSLIHIVQVYENGEWKLTYTIGNTTEECPRQMFGWSVPDEELDFFVYHHRSDPTMKDTDGDHYEDPDDPRPRICDVITIDLGGGSYDPAVEDKGYIHVTDAPNDDDAYGGNQSWFGNVSVNTNGINLLMEETGCGVIATNDVELYLHNGASSYSWPDYYNEVMSTYNEFAGVSFIPPSYYMYPSTNQTITNLKVSSAVSPRFVQLHLSMHGYQTNLYSIERGDYNKTLNRIKTSLKNNKPVILLENDRLASWGIATRSNNCILLKCIDIGEFSNTNQKMQFHYVTITGLYDDRKLGHVYLRVQSWGEEYYIDYNEFYNYNKDSDITWSGDLIFVQ